MSGRASSISKEHAVVLMSFHHWRLTLGRYAILGQMPELAHAARGLLAGRAAEWAGSSGG